MRCLPTTYSGKLPENTGESTDKELYAVLPMIQLTRLNHAPLVLNSDLIEHMDVTPDTVVTLTTGQKIVVLESAEEVVDRIIEYRRSLIAGAFACPLKPPECRLPIRTITEVDEIDG
ncbi:MAG TPA: flagellar FlbD family protein [Bryobacteraceae bacterium]|jgi:flagellar protein FlbD|nr:flagellar FlbD family protein [Bryobacteraceae bacterium]